MADNRARQFSLFGETGGLRRLTWSGRKDVARPEPRVRILCRACREKEARYGFREADRIHRPSTLCFECFRLELERRKRADPGDSDRADPARDSGADWRDELSRRRRRAQIAARRALGPDWP